VPGLVDALHRATRALRSPRRRTTIVHNGMTADWSWTVPAERYLDIYRDLIR
jgi:glycogen synthase